MDAQTATIIKAGPIVDISAFYIRYYSDPYPSPEKPGKTVNKQRRDKIATFLEQSIELKQAWSSQPVDRNELGKRTAQWVNETLKYLRSIDASYAARFNAAPCPMVGPTDTPEIQRWNFIDCHQKVLDKILEELKD